LCQVGAVPELQSLLSPHLAALLAHTVPGGKMLRGMAVPATYRLLRPECSPQMLRKGKQLNLD